MRVGHLVENDQDAIRLVGRARDQVLDLDLGQKIDLGGDTLMDGFPARQAVQLRARQGFPSGQRPVVPPRAARSPEGSDCTKRRILRLGLSIAARTA